MPDFDTNPPPELAVFPAAWYAQILRIAARGPDQAHAIAKVLEEAFATEAPGPKESDARRLINWLRSLT